METVDIKSPMQSACQTDPLPLDERPSSPNDCAICLEQLSDKSFTNSCLHMFCFHCLLAWSKVKPECPLCKQDFRSIIHNIRSMDDYDEYQVPPSSMRFATPDSASFLSSNIPPSLSDFLPRTHDYFSANRRFFSYSTTLLSGGFSVPRQRSSSLVIQPYVDNLQIQNEFSGVNSSSHSFPRLNRKEVYLRELEIRPPTAGRHRVCAPEFYRENESQMHRLGRWLIRELVAISQLGMRFHPNEVLSFIMGLLPMYSIQSTYFYDALCPYLGIHTRRFIREFYNFAVSPYDMDQYDRECVYVRQRTGSQLAFIVTVGGDDSEDVQVIPSPPVNHNHSVNPWMNVNNLPTAPYSRTVPASRSRSTHPTSRCPFSFLPSRASTSHQVIHISDSENDDCIIIDEVRQTPETIVLDDSDTEIAVSVPTTSSTKPMINHSTSPVDLNYQPTTSNDSMDDKNKLILPSTSKIEPSKSPLLAASSSSTHRIRLKSTSKKSSSSNSSVISTDNSVVGSESSQCEGSSRYHKRRSRHRGHSKRRNCTRKSYLFFTDTSSVESDKDDLDYGKTVYKRKRKTKKHDKSEKKSKKRGKTTRTKSPKRKKSPLKDDSYGVSRNETDFASSSSYNFKNSHTEYDVMIHVNGNSNKPKLKSVVKKVNKSETLAAKTESEKKLKISEEDVLPGTSFGFRPSRDRKFNSFFVRQIGFSSDSD